METHCGYYITMELGRGVDGEGEKVNNSKTIMV
jgi:hypothetical protein